MDIFIYTNGYCFEPALRNAALVRFPIEEYFRSLNGIDANATQAIEEFEKLLIGANWIPNGKGIFDHCMERMPTQHRKELEKLLICRDNSYLKSTRTGELYVQIHTSFLNWLDDLSSQSARNGMRATIGWRTPALNGLFPTELLHCYPNFL